MPDKNPPQKYMMKGEIAVEVASLAGIDSYDPSREAHDPADFRKDELKQIYEEITGEEPQDLSTREMNYVMMKELDEQLNSSYPYDLSRQDLKIIHKNLLERK